MRTTYCLCSPAAHEGIESDINTLESWRVGDGKNSEIYQTNHVLRSVYVPDGNHEVVFYYDDSNWVTARLVSRLSFYITIILVCYLFYIDRKVYLGK